MSTRVTSSNAFENLKLSLNSNTTDADYKFGYAQGAGNAFTAATTTNTRHAGVTATSSNTSNIFSANIIYFLGYKNTNWHKGYHIKGANENNGTNAYIQFGSGTFASTSAISSIQISFTADILANSTFNLYGIS
jgi:hypothetical protein